MERFVKDIDEVQAASKRKRTDSLKNEILYDMRIMKELHALGFKDDAVDAYLPILSTYLEQRNAEEDPSHRKIAPYPGMKMTLIVDDVGYLSYALGPNDESKRKQSIETNYIYRDYPDEWMGLTANAIKNIRFKEVKKAFNSSQKLGKRWIYILGDSGTGKSYYLAAILNNFATKGKTVCFMNTNMRFEELKSLAVKRSEDFTKLMGRLKKCDYLVLDDFGNEYRSDYVRDTILMPILNERSRLGLNTYFTSQFTIEEIEELYTTKSKIDGKRVANIIRKNIDQVVRISNGIESR